MENAHNSSEASTKPDQKPIETKLYKRRWIMVAILMFQILLVKMVMASIGVINNAYGVYFDLSYYVIDWFTLIQTSAMVLATFILSVFSFFSVTDSRKLFIFMSSSAIFSCTCTLVSFAFTNLYALLFLGQFLVGLVLWVRKQSLAHLLLTGFQKIR